jgi:hypothetical protein
MPVSESVRAAARRFLDPDDEIRYVFPATLVMSTRPYVVVVVSKLAVKVLTVGRWGGPPSGLEVEYPRQTRLGPVDTDGMDPTFTLGGLRYEVDEEYVAVINAADLERGAGEMPPDPLPDL